MSPQFVDFDADGHIDIVAGTFDGSPHVAYGTPEGWKQPEQILDRDGARIVMNQFWNFDTKKWDSTKRCDPAGFEPPEGHLTSAWAADWDGDQDLDLLLGDHSTGHVYWRANEGDAKKHAFATKNALVLADGKPLKVPGTVTTLRLVDWNADGLLDLLCGGMGDSYGSGEGGGIFLYPSSGKPGATLLGAPLVLVPANAKRGAEPTRPDAGLYMDAGDPDGDGDLDLVVGGYSQWQPPPPRLTDAQSARVVELRAELEVIEKASSAFNERFVRETQGLSEEAAAAKRAEILASAREQLAEQAKRRQALETELDPLVPGAKRVSYVWIYENRAQAAPARKVRFDP